MVLLSIVTLGIYLLYWIYITFAEVRAHRGQGTSGILGLLLALIPVSIFLLPSHVGDMYAEAGKTKPITGYAGLWALIPLVGGIVWLFKVQNRLNEYWAWRAGRARPPRPRRPVQPSRLLPLSPPQRPRRRDGLVQSLVEHALAAFQQREGFAYRRLLEVLRRAVRLERRLVVVDLEDEERPRILRVAACLVEAAAGLLPRRLGELGEAAPRSGRPLPLSPWTGQPAPMPSLASSYGVGECAEAVDLDRDLVAGLAAAPAGRGRRRRPPACR